MAAKVGDRLRFRSGRKVDTTYTPGTADLAGGECEVVEAPTVYRSAVDGEYREHIGVRPILPSGRRGLLLEVPMDHFHRQGLGGAVSRVARACGIGLGMLRRATSYAPPALTTEQVVECECATAAHERDDCPVSIARFSGEEPGEE